MFKRAELAYRKLKAFGNQSLIFVFSLALSSFNPISAQQQIPVADPALPALDAVKESVLSPSLQQLIQRPISIPSFSIISGNQSSPSSPPANDTPPNEAVVISTLNSLPNTPLPTTENLLPLRLVLTPDARPNQILRTLEQMGMLNINRRGNLVTGRLPVQSIGVLENISGLSDVRPAYANVRSGTTFTEGDIAAEADIARSISTLDGSGVTVGVLSDSFDCLGQAASDSTNGDLPAAVNIISDGFCGSDEGRAMLQIVHDIAPGADLAFHTAFLGELNFAAGIDALVQQGADVIIDDVFYAQEPFFQDGVIAQAARDATLISGVPYFTAAGNAGRSSWEGSFVSSGVSVISTGDAHDFATNDHTQSITVAPNRRVFLVLQWDDPYTSLDPSSPGPDTDLDIALLNSAGTIVALSADTNIGSDPYEVLMFDNGPTTQQFDIVIEKQTGPAPTLMKWVGFSGISAINEYDTASGTVVGHANAEAVLSIGAVNFNNTPQYGVSPPQLAAYSSGGPSNILFLPDGSATGPITRDNPDMTAPDAGNNTVIGFDFDGDGFPNFFGSSASVVHAAGVAALLLEHTPTMTASEIETALESTAIDHGPAGYDSDTGHGLVDADAALSTVLVPPSIALPVANQTLSGSTFDVVWAGNEVFPDQWQVLVGSTAPVSGSASSDIFSSGPLGLSTITETITGLPTDGSTLYITLEWSYGTTVESVTIEVLAESPQPPSIVTPAPGTTDPLIGSNVEVTWTPGTATVDQWQLQVGTQPLSADIFDSGPLNGITLSATATGLPLDGQLLYFTLSYVSGGNTVSLEYTYVSSIFIDSVIISRGEWHLLSIPATSAISFAEFIDGHLDPADFNNLSSTTPWMAFRYEPNEIDPETQNFGIYSLIDLSESLESLLEGFWLIHLYPNSVELDLPSDAVHASGIATSGCAPSFYCEQLPLADGGGGGGWSIGSVPSDLEPSVDSLRISTTASGTTCDNGCSLMEADSIDIADKSVWVYDSTASTGVSNYVDLSATEDIPSWSGFWVLTNTLGAQNNAELNVPVR